jgi:hypothetical protein
MKTKDIKFLEIRYLRGPNIWTYRPVIEAVVDIGELEDFPSNTIPGFYERLTALLPSLSEHRCSYGEPAGSCGGCRRAPGRPTSSNTSRSNCRTWPACPEGSARRGKRRRVASTRWLSAPGTRTSPAPACMPAATCCWPPFRTGLSMWPRRSSAWPTWPSASCSGRVPVASSKRRPPRTVAFRPFACWPPATSCNWVTARAADASGPPKPTAPAPSPRASRATRI